MLQEELDVSRSTVYKGIRELEELALVERTTGGYRLSLFGRLLFERYDRLRTDVEGICNAGRLLSELSTTDSISVDLLNGADISYTERYAPFSLIHSLESILKQADSVRGLSPTVLPSYIDMFYEQLSTDLLRAELVLEQPVVECLLSTYQTEFAETIQSGNLRVFETDRRLQYGLVFSDTPCIQVGVFVYDYQGHLRGLIQNDTEVALSWARTVWNEHRELADELTGAAP
jgi:predicted transcriptional regulator